MMRTPSPQLSWLLSLLWPLLLLPLALLGRGRSQIIPTQRGRCAAGDDILNAVACWPPQEMTFELAIACWLLAPLCTCMYGRN
jgi:hypothetical protein